MPIELNDALDRVTDLATFLDFVRALVADREAAVDLEARSPGSPYGPDAGGWENSTIESFLGAAVAWADDSSRAGAAHRLPEIASWRAFADFLHSGKIYE